MELGKAGRPEDLGFWKLQGRPGGSAASVRSSGPCAAGRVGQARDRVYRPKARRASLPAPAGGLAGWRAGGPGTRHNGRESTAV